jgi:uncharacterized membrane protein
MRHRICLRTAGEAFSKNRRVTGAIHMSQQLVTGVRPPTPEAWRHSMSSPRGKGRRQLDRKMPSANSSALEENLETIKRWERTILLARSKAEQVSDWIAITAGCGPVLVLHVVWFGVWLAWNGGVVGGLRAFDPFPFPLLTTAVSLEAIFLTLFVLASQNRLGRQADKRNHLDLQVDLLAEREMTAVLQLLQDIARHLQIQTSVTPEELQDLMKTTDLRWLTDRMEELAEPDEGIARKDGGPVDHD